MQAVMNRYPRLPSGLRPATRRWAQLVLDEFELESHHFRLLVMACQCWDRREEARAALAEHGMTYVDRYGQPRARPEIQIERDATITFARLIRELRLGVEPDDATRLPGLPGGSERRA
jgi:phage terminase small subunit